MDTYIRFQTQLQCCNTGRAAGIFVAAGEIEDRSTLPDVTRDQLRDLLMWFNHNLTVPRLVGSQRRGLFWFRGDAQEIISRLWELASLLEDEGVFTTKVRTCQPGMIVYRDEHQVAAVPQRKKHALRV